MIVMGIEPTTFRLEGECSIQLSYTNLVVMTGFEPAKHNASDLESDPFDRSGTLPGNNDGARTRDLWLIRPVL